MPNPYQKVPRAWPKRIKDKCFDMFVEGYSAPEIEKVTGVPANTMYAWSGENGENWASIRRDAVTDYRSRAGTLINSAVVTLLDAVRVSGKVLSRVEAQLDGKGPLNASVNKSLNDLNDVVEPPSNEVTSQRSDLAPKDLAVLAGALKDASEVLLRVFSK